ncbi:hypothetical protein CPC16_007338 [Podila verticillata]|nr:hypothetical protein CPC16_007338 [Podila verticillata]
MSVVIIRAAWWVSGGDVRSTKRNTVHPFRAADFVVAAKGGKFSGTIGRREQFDGAAIEASDGGGLGVLETVAESLMVLRIKSVATAIVINDRHPKRRKRTGTEG